MYLSMFMARLVDSCSSYRFIPLNVVLAENRGRKQASFGSYM